MLCYFQNLLGGLESLFGSLALELVTPGDGQTLQEAMIMNCLHWGMQYYLENLLRGLALELVIPGDGQALKEAMTLNWLY